MNAAGPALRALLLTCAFTSLTGCGREKLSAELEQQRERAAEAELSLREMEAELGRSQTDTNNWRMIASAGSIVCLLIGVALGSSTRKHAVKRAAGIAHE